MNYKIFVIVWALTLGTLASSHATTCVGSIPYGVYNGFLSLPRSAKFCAFEGGNPVNYETDELGGRLLGEPLEAAVNIFGESQALVIDSDQIPLIYKTLGLERVRIYATPNNGPYEWLTRFVKRQYTPSNQTFFVINLGFDVFRLNSNWRPKDLVDMDISTIENLLNWPRTLTARIAFSQLKLRGSTLSGDDRDSKKKLFQSNQRHYLADIRRWFDLAKSALINQGMNSDNAVFLIFSPYWLDSNSTDDIAAHNDLIQAVSCAIDGQFPAELVAFNYGPISLTSDARHFSHEATPKIRELPACNR